MKVGLVAREQEHREGKQAEDQEEEGAVDRDRPQDDLVAQRLPAQRQLDLVERRQVLARRLAALRLAHRQPAVAAQAAVPAQSVDLAHDRCVLRPDLACIEPDQLVPVDPTRQQLPVETWYETTRFFAYADAG